MPTIQPTTATITTSRHIFLKNMSKLKKDMSSLSASTSSNKREHNDAVESCSKMRRMSDETDEKSLNNVISERNNHKGTDVSSPRALALPSHNWISVLETDATSKDSTLIMVDPLCTLSNSKMWSVVSEEGDSFSASLVLANIKKNINKFYILQLLEFQNEKKYLIYSRSGRVGYDGSEKLSDYFSNLKDAKKFFQDRFYEKTLNHWSDRQTFQLRANKYNYLETYFHAGSTMDAWLNDSIECILSTLDKQLQELLLLINGTNASSLRTWLLKSVTTRIGIPTGKQLVKSFTALNDVLVLLSQKKKGKELVEACNAFYMAMPHDTKLLRPRMLCAETIEDEVLMLQTLAYGFVVRSQRRLQNPLKCYFEKCQWKLEVVDHKSKTFLILQDLLAGLHGRTLNHRGKMDLLDAYKWHKKDELERFEDNGEKIMLWHGTPLSNILGIIKHGLKLPPKNARSRSLMFGRGLYFADCSTKGAGYCRATEENPVILLLFCEVSMGKDPIEILPHKGFTRTDYSKSKKSVKALGQYSPAYMFPGLWPYFASPYTVTPGGPLVIKDDRKNCALNYNEYVIYDERQVRIRYLLKIKLSYL